MKRPLRAHISVLTALPRLGGRYALGQSRMRARTASGSCLRVKSRACHTTRIGPLLDLCWAAHLGLSQQ